MDNVTQENKPYINKNEYGNDFGVDTGTDCLPTVHIDLMTSVVKLSVMLSNITKLGIQLIGFKKSPLSVPASLI